MRRGYMDPDLEDVWAAIHRLQLAAGALLVGVILLAMVLLTR
jgi:hypothetical protein